MKKVLILFLAVGLFSCTDSSKEKDVVEESHEVVQDEKVSNPESKLHEEERDALISKFDENRLAIEAKIHDIKPIEITSEYLRDKIRQKWSKIHIYTENGVILRIKSYPYETISDRCEEFYFYEGKLAMVVMENDGDWTQSQDVSKLDKVFYFENGKLIFEKGGASPYNSLEDMSHELIQEAVEYTHLYEEALKREIAE